MKKLLIAVLLVAVMAAPAFASVQNIKVSGDITATSVLRNNFDLGAGATNQHQNDVLSYARIRIDADLTDNVSTTIRLLNERAWGDDASGTTTENVDVDLAYVQLREMLYSPLTVTLGRQEINYGNGFIISSAGPNNTAVGTLNTIAKDLSMRGAMDAIKLVFNYDPLTIDMLAAIVDSNATGIVGQDKTDDVNLYGINANYKLSDKWNTVAEAYFFAKMDRTGNDTEVRKQDAVYVPGFRVSTNPIKGLNVQAELAWQRGTYQYASGSNSIKREAMGGQFIASYLLPFEKTAKYEPVVTYAYTYASGDKEIDPTSTSTGASGSEYKGWDPMFENVAGGKIYNSLFDLTNVHVNEFSFSAKPVQDVTAKLTWTMLALDKKLTANSWRRTLPDNGTVDFGTKTDKKGLGNELDLDLTYDYTEDVSIGLSAGWYMPGNLFTGANEKTASQLLTSMSVAF